MIIRLPPGTAVSYKAYSIFLVKFAKFILCVVNLGISTILLRTPCCYALITSEIHLFANFNLADLLAQVSQPRHTSEFYCRPRVENEAEL